MIIDKVPFPMRASLVAMLAFLAVGAAGQARAAYSFTASDDWMPYSSAKDPNGGLLVMIAKAAYAVSGREVEVDLLPWARALADARDGRKSGVIGAWYNEDRAKDFIYSDPIMDNEIVFFAFADRGIKYHSLKSLSPYSIGVVRGNGFNDKLAAAGLTLEYVNDFESNLKKLVSRRIDILADEKLSTMRLIASDYPGMSKDIAALSPPLETNTLYLIVPRRIEGASAIVAEFNKGLKAIRGDGTIRRIYRSYGLNP